MYGHGMPGVSNSAAASLWVIDYALQAATLGIDTLHFHSGVGYNYSGECLFCHVVRGKPADCCLNSLPADRPSRPQHY